MNFVNRSYHKRQPLWRTVVREIFWCWSLLPLCFTDMSQRWSSTCHMYDASEYGYGVVCADFDDGELAAAGRLKERNRFDSAAGLVGSHREDALVDKLPAVRRWISWMPATTLVFSA